MNQELTSREKTILKCIGGLLLLALLSSMTSCSGSRGMTNCDAAKYKMSGYR
jgi:hypothetical protein